MHSLVNNQKIYGFCILLSMYVYIRVCICSKFVEIIIILLTKYLCDARRVSKFILVSNRKIH